MKTVFSFLEIYMMGMVPIFLLFGSKGGRAVHDFNVRAIVGAVKFLTVWPAKALLSAFRRAKPATAPAAARQKSDPSQPDATSTVEPKSHVVDLNTFRERKSSRPAPTAAQAPDVTASEVRGGLPPELDPDFNTDEFCDFAVMERRKMYEDYL